MRVVVDAELVRHGQEERVGGRNRLVLGKLPDEGCGEPGRRRTARRSRRPPRGSSSSGSCRGGPPRRPSCDDAPPTSGRTRGSRSSLAAHPRRSRRTSGSKTRSWGRTSAAFRGRASACSLPPTRFGQREAGNENADERDERLSHTTVRSRRRRRRRRDRRAARPASRSATSSRGQGRRFVILEARRLGRPRLARALGLAGPVHAAPLRRPARAAVPRRPRRLSDPRRGDRLPRAVRGDVRAAGRARQRGALGSSVETTDGSCLDVDGRRRSRPTRSSSRPGPFQVPRVPALAGRPRAGRVPDAQHRLPPARGRARRDACSSSAAATPASRSRRSSPRRHDVHLAVGSRQTPLPQRLLGRDLFWWLTKLGLLDKTVESRLGRRAARPRHADRLEPARARRATASQLQPRAVDADGRTVSFADGSELEVDAVIWATGYRPDHSWIELPVSTTTDASRHRRGVTDVPGLYFLGLSWQHTRGSALLGWVKDDAEFIAEQIAATAVERDPPQRGHAKEPDDEEHDSTTRRHATAITFPTDTDGPARGARRREVVELADGDDVRAADRARSRSGSATRPCACSPTTARFPGRRCASARARELVVDVDNDGDLEATVHWHGLRLDNRYDGTHETQAPIPVGGTLHATGSSSPTRASTGTTRTSARTTARSWACTGTSSSSRPTPDYWPPAHRELLADARRRPDRGRQDRAVQPRPRRPTRRWAGSATSCSSAARPTSR